MSAWRGWLTRMRRGVRRDRFEAEMADELRTHLEMEAEARYAIHRAQPGVAGDERAPVRERKRARPVADRHRR